MEIDTRKIITNTLYTIANNSDRKIICGSDIDLYLSLLRKKLGQEIKQIDESDINEQKFEELINVYFEESEKCDVYFIVNPTYNPKQLESIVDKSLLLDKNDIEALINNPINSEHLNELLSIYRNEHNRKYQENVSLNQILEHCPQVKSVSFDGTFKLFMLYYSTIYKNSIKKEFLQEAFAEISQILQSKGVELEKVNNLEFFRIIYDKNRGENMDNPNRMFALKDDLINIKIENLNGFLKEIKSKFNNETLLFMEQLIAFYVTTPHFENKIHYDEINEKEKGL